MRPTEAAAEKLLVAAGVAVLFFLLPHGLNGDDVVRFGDIETLFDQHRLTDSRYSLLMPLASAPVLALGKVVESQAWWAARFNVLVVAAGIVIAARLLRGRVDPALVRRTALVLLFASFLTNRLRDYNAEVFTATLVTLGVLALSTGRRALGWAALVVGVANTPAAIAGLALVAVAEAYRLRRPTCLLPVGAAVALVMAEAWVRRGGLLTTGYAGDHGIATVMPYSGRPGFSYPFVFGLVSILFSFGRGLLFFMPGLLFWASGRGRRPIALLLLFVAGLVLVYAKWWAWYGGASWGPRFFVVAAVPASILLAMRLGGAGRSLGADAATLGVLVLSAWVSVAGAIAAVSPPDACTSHRYALEALCWYSPEFSPLGSPLVRFPPVSTGALVVCGYCALVLADLAAGVVRPLALRARSSTSR